MFPSLTQCNANSTEDDEMGCDAMRGKHGPAKPQHSWKCRSKSWSFSGTGDRQVDGRQLSAGPVECKAVIDSAALRTHSADTASTHITNSPDDLDAFVAAQTRERILKPE
jgi:hypothetical protein